MMIFFFFCVEGVDFCIKGLFQQTSWQPQNINIAETGNIKKEGNLKKKQQKTAKLKWQTETQEQRNNGDVGQSENKS